MNCPKCKSYDVMFSEINNNINYSCNSCGYQWLNEIHCNTFVQCNNAEGCFGCKYEEEQDFIE